MNRIITLILVFSFSMFVAGPIMAQKGDKKAAKAAAKIKKKAEKNKTKAWKKKAKNYVKNPLNLEADMENCNSKLRDLGAKNKALQSQLADCNSSLDSMRTVMLQAVEKLQELEAKYEKLQTAYQAKKENEDKGIIRGLNYKVQIGAFVHFDINKYLKETDKNFEGAKQDGMNKYTMGNFRDFQVADAFKLDVQKMGIKDAFVVPYIDGIRVSIEEAEKFISEQGGGN